MHVRVFVTFCKGRALRTEELRHCLYLRKYRIYTSCYHIYAWYKPFIPRKRKKSMLTTDGSQTRQLYLRNESKRGNRNPRGLLCYDLKQSRIDSRWSHLTTRERCNVSLLAQTRLRSTKKGSERQKTEGMIQPKIGEGSEPSDGPFTFPDYRSSRFARWLFFFPRQELLPSPIFFYSPISRFAEPGARFSNVPIINGPGKLSPFTLKIELSIVLRATWYNCQLVKQNGAVC